MFKNSFQQNGYFDSLKYQIVEFLIIDFIYFELKNK